MEQKIPRSRAAPKATMIQRKGKSTGAGKVTAWTELKRVACVFLRLSDCVVLASLPTPEGSCKKCYESWQKTLARIEVARDSWLRGFMRIPRKAGGILLTFRESSLLLLLCIISWHTLRQFNGNSMYNNIALEKHFGDIWHTRRKSQS